MFKMYDGTDIASGVVFKIYDEPESPSEGACLRYMMEPTLPMRRRV